MAFNALWLGPVQGGWGRAEGEPPGLEDYLALRRGLAALDPSHSLRASTKASSLQKHTNYAKLIVVTVF